jgi:hypothetical protein
MSGTMLDGGYPVARKPHRCDYCHEDIPRGQRYHRWAWVADGDCSTVRAHIACDAVAADYYDAAGAYSDERWVCADPIDEWARNRGDVRGDLSALAGRTPGWPDGEADRLAAWMAR